METLNSLLSNDIGYLNALRQAPPVPQVVPVVNPPEVINIPAKKFKIPIWGWILAGAGLCVFATYKWRASQQKNKSKTI